MKEAAQIASQIDNGVVERIAAGLAALRRRHVQEVYLEVRVSNEPAQALYRAAHFQPVGRRRSLNPFMCA